MNEENTKTEEVINAPATHQENQELEEYRPEGTIVEVSSAKKEYHPIFPGMDFEKPKPSYFMLPTVAVVVTLILIFFIVKKFVYTPDDRRDGK